MNRNPSLSIMSFVFTLLSLTSMAGEDERVELPADLAFALGSQYAPSMEMKENVDFICIPACFVQQSLLQGEILLYPHQRLGDLGNNNVQNLGVVSPNLASLVGVDGSVRDTGLFNLAAGTASVSAK